MPRLHRWLVGVVAVAAAALGTGCQGRPAPASSAAPAQRTVHDGVYTEMQSRYGASVFDGACARCHSISEWQHESFLRSWSGRTVGDLYSRIRDTMPRGAPASLAAQEYADVVAFLLALNGLPTGVEELGTAEAELRAIVILRGNGPVAADAAGESRTGPRARSRGEASWPAPAPR